MKNVKPSLNRSVMKYNMSRSLILTAISPPNLRYLRNRTETVTEPLSLLPCNRISTVNIFGRNLNILQLLFKVMVLR